MKKSFMPRTEAEKLSWLKNFANKLSTYATKYGITAAEITDMKDAAAYYDYWYDYAAQYSEYNKKLTQYKAELRDGIAAEGVSVVPTPPSFVAAPTAVQPGVFVRASNLAAIIKKRNNYTEADGNDLGIEGVEDTTSLAKKGSTETKPIISVRQIQGGKPEIVWTKGNFDGIDVYVDRGNNQFVFLATDTYPNYIDNAPLPASAAVWKYKAIYRYGDDPIGSYSDVVSIAVGAGV